MASLSGRRCLVVRPVTPSKPFDRSRSGGSERKEGQWIDYMKYPVIESRVTFVYCNPESTENESRRNRYFIRRRR
jgi:hypothetical protein